MMTLPMAMRYPIAPSGIFRSVQGEGFLLGVPMRFVRLAGCSVGCKQCDTDYRVSVRMKMDEIEQSIVNLGITEWIAVTGGEPHDHDLGLLLEMLRRHGRVMLSTSGMRPGNYNPSLVTFLSVSPHGTPSQLLIRMGSQVNLVPGLGELNLADWDGFDFSGFRNRYVTPLHDSSESFQSCMAWLKRHPEFRLGVQAHKAWGLA